MFQHLLPISSTPSVLHALRPPAQRMPMMIAATEPDPRRRENVMLASNDSFDMVRTHDISTFQVKMFEYLFPFSSTPSILHALRPPAHRRSLFPISSTLSVLPLSRTRAIGSLTFVNILQDFRKFCT